MPYQPPLPPNEAPSGVDAAAGVTPVGLRPPFVTPAAAHSHPDCRGILILIVAPHPRVQPTSAKRFISPSVSASERAASRACSWISRGILRDGSFGQHRGLSGHTSLLSLLARYRSVLPSCTVPLVPSRFPPGQW